MKEFDIVVGLEVHVQLKTESKIFCTCPTSSESQPNSNICPVCAGYPGALPVFNKKALELALKVCFALRCQINKKIYFERKNYFYPDLPKNYQISQYKMPLGEKGHLELASGRIININRVHLEEDAGKLIHKEKYSLVDLNRAGTPLLEIVSAPDINGSEEAFEYLTHLKLILQYIEASDCDMEKGSLRCDANISLKKKGNKSLGTKVELKNMNSFRGVRDALDFEAKRQEAALGNGEKICQETRLWDEELMRTETMRIKEEAHDYRYFPEPDLLDFAVSENFLKKEQELIGELPLDKRKRFAIEYKISSKEINILISHRWLANFFEEAFKFYPKAQEVSNWLIGPFLEQVNNSDKRFDSVKISAQNFAKIVKYFVEGKINNLAAKKVLCLSINTNEDADVIIEKEKLLQVSDANELDTFVKGVIGEHLAAVSEYRQGKQEVLMFLVGQVMKKTKGKANPKVTREMLEKAIREISDK